MSISNYIFYFKFIVYIYSSQAIFSYPPSLFSLLFSICLKLFQHFNRQKSNNNMYLPIIGDLVKQVRTPPVRTMSGVRKPPLEFSVPGENLPRGSRRNQFWRGHGSPSVLNEVFSNLARLCASKSANGPRKNSF